MSLAIQGDIQQGHVDMGQNGRVHQWGIFTFNSTDANGELPLNMHAVEDIQLTAIGAPATDEQPYIDEVPSGGMIIIPTTGTVTVARTGASKTADLSYFYHAIGVG